MKKNKIKELDVDIIGSQDNKMTLEEERSVSEFIKELKETQQSKIKILKKSKKIVWLFLKQPLKLSNSQNQS